MSTIAINPKDVSVFKHDTQSQLELQDNWGWILAFGVVTSILGVVAIATPLFTTLASQVFLGWMFLFYGIAEIFHVFKTRKHGGKIAWLFFGALVSIVGGIFLIGYPLAGALSLTLFLSIVLVFCGVERCLLAYQLREMKGSGWILFNGIVTLLLGGMIFAQWPSSALWVLGLLIGVNILTSGISISAFALLLRSVHKKIAMYF